MLVQDRDGRAVGIGTTARTVTPALRRALSVRDGHCRFGDCTARRFLHGHHIVHWPAPTEMGNLALVCYQHHHSLHEGGWTLTGDPFGQLVATHPDGRRTTPNLPQSIEDTHPPGCSSGPPGPAGAFTSIDGDRSSRPVGHGQGAGSADEPSLFEDTG